jgi:hypothetical protein
MRLCWLIGIWGLPFLRNPINRPIKIAKTPNTSQMYMVTIDLNGVSALRNDARPAKTRQSAEKTISGASSQARGDIWVFSLEPRTEGLRSSKAFVSYIWSTSTNHAALTRVIFWLSFKSMKNGPRLIPVSRFRSLKIARKSASSSVLSARDEASLVKYSILSSS